MCNKDTRALVKEQQQWIKGWKIQKKKIEKKLDSEYSVKINKNKSRSKGMSTPLVKILF